MNLLFDAKDMKEYLLTSETFNGGTRKVFMFDNGYGASVIKNPRSYGGDKDLWELAVMKKTDDGGYDICYSTPVTNDVIGYLNNDDVIKYLKVIRDL